MYRQWRVLRGKYIGDQDETDRLLPAAAALLLQARAYESSGLMYSDDVWRRIYQLSGEYRVPVWPQNYDTKLVAGEWRRTGKARANGVKYLAQTMDRLSSDIRDARAAGNAWAMESLRICERRVIRSKSLSEPGLA
jgi:hypothetical protein